MSDNQRPEQKRLNGGLGDGPDQLASSGVAVIGVGASAGGLKAFRLLLSALPPDTGFAFVLVQHLDPTHQSSLSEILSRATTMPVAEAQDGMKVEADHVYVIPPNASMTITNRVLQLSTRGVGRGPHMPIDHFFRSLAEDCRSMAVGVILSGAGSDGSLGLQSVKEAGGITFAQEGASAEYASMPHMAELASRVDFVLPPEGIAAELARIARHPHFAVAQLSRPEVLAKDSAAGLSDVVALMHEATGIDFSLYRAKTVQRRISRRLALRNITIIGDYISVLKNDAQERSLLQRDLLISVTSFFRDPPSFEALAKHVFPVIVQNRKPGTDIRIWVPGCATGEEAYSIAIALQEYLKETNQTFPVQIFASDISEAVIEKARSGKYPENISADVGPERLERFFRKIDGGYQVSKSLRELCVFSRHNLIDDPAFARLDLISCRNVLIYLGSVQRHILPMFHYALKPGGYLMLGRSEKTGFDDLFSLVDVDTRIYIRKETSKRQRRVRPRLAPQRRFNDKATAVPVSELWDGVEIGRVVDDILLSKYSPAAILVDQGLEVLEVRGDPTPFFKLPAGKVSFHLLKLIPDTGLFLEIEKLIQLVEENGESARRMNVRYEREGSIREVNIEVTPLYGHQKRALLVLLEPLPKVEEQARSVGDIPVHEERSSNALKDHQILKLRQELGEMRRRLTSAIEKHQLAEEESHSAAEEALSANEELQSLNEELETAKEELQSTNEELITVNQELALKNTALTESSAFSLSIVETIHVPLVVVDHAMRVRTVNEWFSKSFLIPKLDAEGHRLQTLGGGRWDLPGLAQRVDRVLTTGEAFENLEVTREFPSIGTRHLIINGRRLDPLSLVLLAIEDVTIRKNAESALHESQEALRQAQKMEAIGRLAGGIAHDFNNLLTAIIGYGHLIADSLGKDHPVVEDVHEIERAGLRASALTAQLLAFSRRKGLKPRVFDLNTVVVDFEKMLRRIVGEQIKVIVRTAHDLGRVQADPGEIGRALMNLCLNARDAMPARGTLTIETSNVTIVSAQSHPSGFGPGAYVSLVVRDTGIGMDAETKAQVFDPFFTTKEAGKGTGLGLAAVQSIITQSGGAIWFQSEPNKGTGVHILLPAVSAPPDLEEAPAGRLREAPRGSAEVILLVEDEDQVRKLTSRILEDRGYIVLEATDGGEGLSVGAAHPGKIDLLLSDVVMPEVGGRDLADHIQTMRPGIKVLFMSGYTQDLIQKEGVLPGTPFLSKPFSPAELAHKVREVLDA